MCDSLTQSYPMKPDAARSFAVKSKNLQERLSQIHDRILETVPDIDRIACALYDPSTDILKTFINSTHKGIAITGYEYKLSSSTSLSALAKSGEYRVLVDMHDRLKPINQHTEWLLQQGYQSSFTIPIFNNESFVGFLFFDSTNAFAFNSIVQRDLVLYSNLINMTLTTEFAKVNSIAASALIAKDFTNLRDFETGAHIERVARISRIIAKSVSKKYGITDEMIEYIYMFAPLHDIGKIGIPDEILLKQGRLDSEERKIMQTHVVKGVEMIERIIHDFNLANIAGSSVLLNIVACHHEFMDGSGYPRGLKGSDIPVEARILTVADILDALVSHRPYKSNWSIEACMYELTSMVQSGKLDSACVLAIEENYDAVLNILEVYQD